MNEKPWRLELSCCGYEDGVVTFDTWDEADAFRESYTSGPAVDPHGYSGADRNAHQRAAILSAATPAAPEEPQP